MSLTQSSSLLPYQEIVPDSLRAGGLTKASSVVERRRIRVAPQGAANYGSAGAGAGSQQIQFLIAGDGMLDCRSAVLNFTLQTTGSNSAPDDFGIFGVVQTILNGNVVENVTSCAKVINSSFRTGVSKSFYETAGATMGAQLLNGDLQMTLVDSTVAAAGAQSSYGYVDQNYIGVATRAQRAAFIGNNSLNGCSFSVPLSVISDFWKTQQALPLGILGEINYTLVTNNAVQALFSGATAFAGDYSLQNVNITYDVLIPSNDLMMLYKQVAMDPNDAGLNYVVQSTICTQAGNIAASAGALSEYVAIASRATSNLIKSTLLLVNAAGAVSGQFPSQSCFSYANTYSTSWRIGSQVYPQLNPNGPADLYTMTLNSIGSTTVENGTAINRLMWANTTDFSTPGTPAVYAASSECTTAKFVYADSFIPTMSFEQIRGGYDKPSLSGVSLSGNSGSQLICSFVAAPPTAYQVFLTVTALKVIKAQGASVRVEGP
jgi:hypothetical protein